ncbi:trigger factor [Labrys sp. ZIDIC5]|uniref:trigger factor n=1 Tax=Labrys sedimenti TaxID=3106036 RepID=UPI002ACAE9F6|nr:trigger factor [Labrys sp. ZIDIC5]MDZ5448993.1 trigger factor [Labrys sp. ZIDIC5]
MQVTQTLADGLKREFKVVVPAADIASRTDAQLEDMKGKVRVNGFRPGKVPVAHLRRLYGRSVTADVVNNFVGEANRKIVDDNQIKLAMEPKLDFGADDEGVTQVLDGKADLAWTVAVEVLPTFEVGDINGIKIVKPVAEVADEEVQSRLEDLARRNVTYADKKAKSKAENHDRVIVDFVGKIDGVEFDGGKGEDISVDLGSKTFIPGFEDQLIGVTAGQEKTIEVKFPTNYASDTLAGKDATFDVKVKAVQAPAELVVDDELAKSVGLESLDKLKEVIKSSIEGEYNAASRSKVKRQLLDALDAKYSFDLPPTLFQQEFDNVWLQVEREMQQTGRTFEQENTTEEAAKEDYRKIAARRVRLGLVLAEIGESNKIQVTDEEATRAVIERARQFPGQERQIWEFYTKNPQAIAELRAPIFEDKVVDHILSLADVTENKVSKEDLFKEDDEQATSAAAEDKPAKPKKAKAAKASAETAE